MNRLMSEPNVTSPESGLKIVRADNSGPMTLDGTRTYVVGTSRLAIVDPGPIDVDHLGRIYAAIAGRQVATILLTHAHADHSGLARETARALGAPIQASAETLERLSVDGIPVTDGEPVAPGADVELVALRSPGHSSDHTTYLSEPDRWVFTGDLVLGEGSSAILHPDGNVTACLSSLARLCALRPTKLFPGHGPPIADGLEVLEKYRAHRIDREDQIVRSLTAGARDVPAIRKAVYGSLPEGLVWAAEASIAAHLAALAEAGYDVPAFDSYGVSSEKG
jgi:glyoxylase-like metal-dependent hydrolase (beta-lactamase superfamily II)